MQREARGEELLPTQKPLPREGVSTGKQERKIFIPAPPNLVAGGQGFPVKSTKRMGPQNTKRF